MDSASPMRALVIFAAVVLLGITPLPAQADVTIGDVSRIYPTSSDRVYFRIVGDTCKTHPYYWYFDLGSKAADAWYSMLLAAAHNKTPLKIAHAPCVASQHQSISYIYQDF